MKKFCTIMLAITLFLSLITAAAYGAVQGREESRTVNAEIERQMAAREALEQADVEKVAKVAASTKTVEETTEETTEEETTEEETYEEETEEVIEEDENAVLEEYVWEEETEAPVVEEPIVPEPIIDTDSALGQQIVNYAMQWVGVTPYVSAEYRWNGSYYNNSLTGGTDCSGFLYLIFSQFGISASPASDYYQYAYTEISYEQLRPGDVIVYNYGGHVALYAGGDMIIHCKTESEGTVYQSMWYGSPTRYVRLINQ